MGLPSPGDVRDRVRALTLRRAFGVAGVTLLALLLAGAVGFYVYFGVLGLHAPADVERSVRADPNVTVERAYGGYVVGDADPGVERVGVVFYPGGRVAPDAYLPSAARIVTRANVTVVVPKMRANLAVFSQGRADAVIAGEPEIERWVVGTRDAVLDREQFAETESNLPSPRKIVRIEGMNHSQAGWYAGQSGGQPATITTSEAHRRLAAVVADWLCRELDHCAGGPAGTANATGRAT
ncbi:MAG: alpha/beta hydrolase [Haloarculaceae archaeon]